MQLDNHGEKWGHHLQDGERIVVDGRTVAVDCGVGGPGRAC